LIQYLVATLPLAAATSAERVWPACNQHAIATTWCRNNPVAVQPPGFAVLAGSCWCNDVGIERGFCGHTCLLRIFLADGSM